MENSMRYISTKIPTLDAMLGGKGFKTGTINIIKGGPGSGKTTLGLQILNEHLMKNKENRICNAIFISLEVPGEKIKDYLERSHNFNFKNEIYNNQLQILSRKDLKDGLSDWEVAEKNDPENPLIRFIDRKNIGCNLSNENSENIIFIDSLNIFIDILDLRIRQKIYDRRALVNILCGDLTSSVYSNNSVFIFSVEHRPNSKINESLFNESFLSDSEIILRPETLSGKSQNINDELDNAGYFINTGANNKKETEIRPFLKVLKSRFSKNQSRRCAYEIQSGKGFIFKELYPGDGEINLFYDNQPQKQYWEKCFNQDLKFSYPSLRQNTFDRENLQSTFSSLRHLNYIPAKTDMYLTSLDNYWISWYSDLKRKSYISKIVKTLRKQETNDDIIRNVIINKIHELRKDNEEELDSQIRNDIYNIKVNINDFNTDNFADYIQPNSKEYQEIKNSYLLEINDIIKDNEKISNIIINKIHNEFTTNKFDFDILRDKLSKKLEIKIKKAPAIASDKSRALNNTQFSLKISEIVQTKILDQILNEFLDIYSKHEFVINYTCNYKFWLLEVLHQSLEQDDVYLKEFVTSVLIKIQERGKWEAQVIEEMLTEFEARHSGIKVDILNLAVCLNMILDSYFNNTCPIIYDVIRNRYLTYLKIINRRIAVTTATNHGSKNNSANIEAINNLIQEFEIKTCAKSDLDSKFCTKCCDDKHNAIKSDISDFIKKIEKQFSDGIEIELNETKYTVKASINLDLESLVEQVYKSYTKLLFALKKSLNIENDNIINNYRNDFIYSVIHSYYRLNKDEAPISYLEEIKEGEIQLFGEVRSQIISELDSYKFKENRPLHYKDMLFSVKDKKVFISIPYNANISYLVYRKEILIDLYNDISKEEYLKKLKEILVAEIHLLKVLSVYEKELFDNNMITVMYINESKFYKEIIHYDQKEDLDKILSQLVDLSFTKMIPKTWEEIIVLFLLANYVNPHLLIETRTFDTFMTIFLEFFWSYGGNIFVSPDYTIDNVEDTFTQLLMAYNLISLMSHNDIIPQNSTVDPKYFHSNNIKSETDWLFARHWHSTFIDFLTYESQNGFSISRFLDKNEDTKLEIMSIPTSLISYISKGNKAKHISCWGDWHFAMIKESENRGLGINVINYLMNSFKIQERAFSGAELPTVEKFYKLHADTTCFNLENVKTKHLPLTTYNQMRNWFFKGAKSRSQIFDYRHTMSEFGAIFQYAHFGAYPANDAKSRDLEVDTNKMPKKIYKRLYKAIELVNKLREKNIMQF